MICNTCKNDVYPVVQMMNVIRCEGCNAELRGVKEIDRPQSCACGYTGHIKAIREFVNRCPIEQCRAAMPPMEAVAELPNGRKAPTPKPAESAAETTPQPPVDAGSLDVIGLCKARLVVCRDKIKELRKYEREAAQLELMIAAAESNIAAE